MGQKMLMLDIGTDMRLLEWLLSNPVGEVYSVNTPVMGIEFHTLHTNRRGETKVASQGFRRWPIVPEMSNAG